MRGATVARAGAIAAPGTDTPRSGGLAVDGHRAQRAWQHEGAPPALRKRILRAALVEIVVTVADNIVRLVLHWQGGSHTELRVRKNRTGEHRLVVAETVELSVNWPGSCLTA